MINGASSVAARLLNVFGLLWMYHYLLSRISAEEFAIYPVVTAVMVFAPIFFSFVTGGVSRYIVEAYAKGDFDRVAEIVSSVLPLLMALSLAFMSLGLTFAYFADSILVFPAELLGSVQLMLGMLVLSFSLQMLLLPFGTGFHVKQRFVELNFLGVMRDLIRIALLFTLLLGIGPAVIWVVVSGTIADLLHLAAVTYRSRKLVPEIRIDRKLYRWVTASQLVSFGLWTTLGRLAVVMYTHAGTLVLNAYGTAVDVTNYHLGASFFTQIDSMVSLARQPLQPALIAMHSLDDRERLARTALRDGRYGLWAALIVACPLAIYASDFISLLLGDTFSNAAIVIILFMVIFPFNQPAGLVPMIAIAQARIRNITVAAFVSTLAGLFLMIGFVAFLEWGAIGSAVSLTIVTVLVQVGYIWPLNFRMSGITPADFRTKVLYPGLLPAVTAGIVWVTLKFVLPPESWFLLGLVTSIGGLVYVLVLAVFCFDQSDRDMVFGLLRKVRP